MKAFILFVTFFCAIFCFQLRATTYILISKNGNNGLVLVPGQSKENFAVICKNLTQAHSYIITNLYSKNKEEITDDITIYIRKGQYQQEYVFWEATSPRKKINILSYL